MPDREAKIEKKEEKQDEPEEVKDDKEQELGESKMPRIAAGDRGLWETD